MTTWCLIAQCEFYTTGKKTLHYSHKNPVDVKLMVSCFATSDSISNAHFNLVTLKIRLI